MKKLLSMFVVSVLLLSGCAHLAEEKKFEKLEATQKLFWKSLRWKTYGNAANVIRFRNPERKLGSIDNLNKITVTNYEETPSMPTDEEGVFTTLVEFSYVQNETGRLLKTQHKETWWYDKEAKSWFLDSEMPNFKFD